MSFGLRIPKGGLASIDIQLPQSEVFLLIRQPYRVNSHEGFHISFPMAISADCLVFVVLRTLSGLQLPQSNVAVFCSRTILPLEFLSHYETKWTSRFDRFATRVSLISPHYYAYFKYLRETVKSWTDCTRTRWPSALMAGTYILRIIRSLVQFTWLFFFLNLLRP